MNRRDFIGFMTTATLFSVAGCNPRAGEATQLRTQFGWLFDAHHAGFIYALREGLYQDAGLGNTLLPGGSDTNPVRMVVSGAAQIGQAGGIEQLVTAADQGLPINAFAAIHRKSPHALISTERNPIRGPGDIPGKRIAVAYGDAAEVLLKAFLRHSQIGLNAVELVPFRFDITPLLRGDIDAVTGFRTDQPATIRARGQRPVTLAYDEFGISSYGYTLFSADAFAQGNQTTIERFIAASREGWNRAFHDPGRAIEHLQAFLGAPIERAVELEKLNLIRDIMLEGQGALADWRIESVRLEQVIGYLKAEGQVSAQADPATLINRLVTAH